MALLNIDLGETADEPDELYGLCDLANLACGGHAGDAATVAHAIARCRVSGTAWGAHPSYPDREGFGRRRVTLSPGQLAASLRAQCALVPGATHVKPHGALYHDADADDLLAGLLVDAAVAALGPVAIVGPDGGALAAAAARAGLRYLREGFADRGLAADGRLLPRGTPGALITAPDEAAAQARRLAPRVDTICVHADTPGAVAIARAVRYVLSPIGQVTPVPPIPQ